MMEEDEGARGEGQVGRIDSPSFYLFINSGSGGNLGSKLLSQEIQKIEFKIEFAAKKYKKCSVYFYSLKNNEEREKGFANLKAQIQNKTKCYAIVCGGDGTVMWVINELLSKSIKVLDVPIGIIPLGTGNDFSRELGWGGEKTALLQNNYRSLKKLICRWLSAREEYFDIWDIEAEIFEEGKFEKVEKGQNKVIEGMKIKKTFVNYFSFGIDGKIGYGFDMHRMGSRLGNLAMYGIMGLVKAATRTKTLDQLLESIEIHKQQKDNIKNEERSMMKQENSRNSLLRGSSPSLQKRESSLMMSKKSFEENSSHGSGLFLTLQPQQKGKKMSKEQRSSAIVCEHKNFKSDFYSILMLNINSYTGGVSDIWDKSKEDFISSYRQQDVSPVSTGDGKIETVAFSSSVAIAMERTFGGFASRVQQGSGPFVFNYRRYEGVHKHRTYLQIDGEFVRFTAPRRVRVSRSEAVPMGKIKVLRRRVQGENPFDASEI